MTGIAATTLRAWERRYGIPTPARTASSYRVYSDTDIEMIRRLNALCEQGMSPSEAANLVREEAVKRAAQDEANVIAVKAGDDPFLAIRSAVLEAVTAFDPARLARELEKVFALGGATTIVDRVLRPVLVEIGDAWHEGRMTVAQEHLASEALGATVRRLIAVNRPDEGSPTVLLGCFAEEQHSIGLLCVAVHMSSWGWQPILLGANTPPTAVGHAVGQTRPTLVALSLCVAPPPHRARELVDGYADAVGETPWLVGGQGARAIGQFVLARGGGVSTDFDPRAIRRTVEETCPLPVTWPRS